MKLLVTIYVGIVVILGVVFYQDANLKESMARGSQIYSDFCVNCHLDNGNGVSYTFPPLANSDFLKNNREASIHAVKFGLQGKITVNNIPYNSNMMAMGLEDEEIADVMNYIMNSWGNTQENMVTVEEVSALKK